MKHPKSSDVLKVIKNLESVLPLAIRENHLNMSCIRVNTDGYTCGTIHCHAGWYAVACELHKTGIVDYNDGSHRMVIDLGFKNMSELKYWAEENPTIWGNEFGDRMFGNRSAFFHPTKRPNGALNIQDIINHWKEVADKLEKLEAKENPKYRNITKELAVLPVEEKSDLKINTEVTE